mmetsp:Transcript_40284/g.125558  ORF Transcript_40284/g.125558 Transcript_40284/m.125558 type:complete len:259 (+) Transcript_40284:1433-2209(+)
MPLFIKACSSLVRVALKRPVRRCLGRCERMVSRSIAKPSCNNLSASSMTKTSSVLKLITSLPTRSMSFRIRPGVAATICNSPFACVCRISAAAALASAPPMKSCFLSVRPGVPSLIRSSRSTASRILARTSWIWPASSRVGASTREPTLNGAGEVSVQRMRISTMGIKKASVLPEPVQASTATSRWFSNSGMAMACTGVIRLKPVSLMKRLVPAETCRLDHSLVVVAMTPTPRGRRRALARARGRATARGGVLGPRRA